MSKGLGKWQRLILLELEAREAFYVRGLVPHSAPRSDVSAVNRAAYKLARAGKIGLFHHFDGKPGGMRTVVCRPGMAAHDAIESIQPGWKARREHALLNIRSGSA